MKLVSYLSVALVLAACDGTSSIGHGTLDGGSDQNSNDQPDSGTPSGTGGAANPPNDALTCVFDIEASEANNYALSASFDLELTHIAQDADLTIDWSGVTTDFLGRPLDPKTDIDYLEISVMDYKGMADRLTADFKTLSPVVNLLDLDTMGSRTHAGLADLDVRQEPPLPNDVHSDFDVFAFGGLADVVSIVSTSAAGNETRMFAPFVADLGSQNTSVVMTSHSTTLEYAADFSALTPVHLRPHDPHAVLDWGKLATDVFGRSFPQTIRDVRITEHSASRADLAADVMDLDAVADHVWSAPVGSQTSLDLSTLTDDDGQPFPGIDPMGHTWLIALYADDGFPAPAFLTALEPCTAAR